MHQRRSESTSHPRRFWGLVTMVLAVGGALGGCGGTSTSTSNPTTAKTTTTPTTVVQNTAADQAAAEAAVLKLSDLPSGWTSAPASSGDTPTLDAELAACLGVTPAELNPKGAADVVSPDFSDGGGVNSISSQVGYTADSATAQHQLAVYQNTKLRGCLGPALTNYFSYLVKHPANPTDTLPPGVTLGTPMVDLLPFPTVGDQTVAFRTALPLKGGGISINVYADIVVGIKGRARVEMDFIGAVTPFPTDQEQKYLQTVVGRLTNTGR